MTYAHPRGERLQQGMKGEAEALPRPLHMK